MRIAVPREVHTGERRVATTPDVVKQLLKLNFEVAVEAGAGVAKVLIIGAGVAGLAAIGTAKSMGAIVRAFDTRPEVKEQVESMDAEFLMLEFEEEGAGEAASCPDEAYAAAGAQVITDPRGVVDAGRHHSQSAGARASPRPGRGRSRAAARGPHPNLVRVAGTKRGLNAAHEADQGDRTRHGQHSTDLARTENGCLELNGQHRRLPCSGRSR